ncbi:MAG: hypothetical protein M5U01_28915 [Ardenticatenaceae bacterium]|nr:hypothetical protein [Ardenticatenaceae bacterium]
MPRMHVCLDGQWDFFPDPQQHLQPDTLERDGPPRRIQVPGPWQAQFDDLRDYTGVAWYRCSFDLPGPGSQQAQSPPQPTYSLHFGAVDYHATVWLNGHLIGEHEGGYLPFELGLDGAVRLGGSNELVVRVIDPSADITRFPEFPFAEIPHGKQSWYGPIGGIWQSVCLEARHTTHITRLQITPDVPGEQAQVTVHLNQPAPRRLALVLTVTDPLGQETQHHDAIEPGEQQHRATLPVPAPMLWDTHSPHLYQLEAGLFGADQAGLLLDATTSTFGMRTIATSPDGHLMLNGRILYLRGALDQDYYPHTIYTPFSDAELDEQFAKARHMGLNCLRTHIKITDPRYYNAADRAGLLIWTELPNWENLSEAAKRRAHETLIGMIERDWNHPSIIIWTIINEGWGVDLAVNAEHRAWLAETYAYLKELDPYRLVVGNSPCFANFHVVTDIEDFHNYYAIPDHYHEWHDWVETFAGRPPWTFAHTYENVQAWREFMRDPWKPVMRPLAPEVRRRGNEPMVVSEFGNWGLPNVARLRECYGGREPWWFETGLEWGDGVVYPHGVEQRFKKYHLDQVFPSLSDLAAASQRMQFTALKYEIEQIRRHPSIVGYVITEFTDVHWECNGLLDMCRNPKAFYDVIGQINSADVLVPDWERVAFWEGERCGVQVALSHFSSADLRGSRLEWRLDCWPEISGTFEGLMPEPAELTRIGSVVFEAPRVEESVRARLELRLFDAAGALVTGNHHELYIFPRAAAEPVPRRLYAPSLAGALESLGYRLTDDLAGASLAVVETMTDELRSYLQSGGRVLWLAEARDSQQTPLGSLGIAQRRGRSWQGDWASNFSWLRQDRMFRDIPTGGTVDFAFADLTPDQVIVGLSPRDFAADVHAGLFVGWIHHTVALVAERRFGSGRLLASTFRLREHLQTNPVARIMFDDMLKHLASPLPNGHKVLEGATALAGVR